MGFFNFNLFEILFFIVFIMVLCSFASVAVKNILRWNKNNHSPRLTVEAGVVAKRTHISRQRYGNTEDVGYQTMTSTEYFVTFQVESGDRMELSVSGSEYGMLAEGDRGRLSFQGTRFLDFERNQ